MTSRSDGDVITDILIAFLFFIALSLFGASQGIYNSKIDKETIDVQVQAQDRR